MKQTPAPKTPTPYDALAQTPPSSGEFGFGQIGAYMQQEAYRRALADAGITGDPAAWREAVEGLERAANDCLGSIVRYSKSADPEIVSMGVGLEVALDRLRALSSPPVVS